MNEALKQDEYGLRNLFSKVFHWNIRLSIHHNLYQILKVLSEKLIKKVWTCEIKYYIDGEIHI